MTRTTFTSAFILACFPGGGVCHGEDEEETYRQLRRLVRAEIEELIAAGRLLSEPATRPMRETAGV